MISFFRKSTGMTAGSWKHRIIGIKLLALVLLPEVIRGGSPGWIEPGTPFFTMTIDGRHHSHHAYAQGKNNIAVRGTVVNLGEGVWASFDTDLLRWSHSWVADKDSSALELTAMAPNSYLTQGKKTPSGQRGLTKSQGSLITSLGIIPGFTSPSRGFLDPRPPTGDINEPGSGPLPTQYGKWLKTTDLGSRIQIDYSVFGGIISEIPFALNGGFARYLRISDTGPGINLAITQAEGKSISPASLPISIQSNFPKSIRLVVTESGMVFARVAPGLNKVKMIIHVANPHTKHQENIEKSMLDQARKLAIPEYSSRSHWARKFISESAPWETEDMGMVMDYPVPELGDTHRDIRPSAISFRDRNTAFVATFDGDVWQLTGSGLHDSSHHAITWQKIATGLHEPQSLIYHQDSLFSFTRDGIIMMPLSDTSPFITEYINYNNQFTQSTETREFPMDMVMDRNGNFFLAKGGQKGGTPGFENGTILKVRNGSEPAEVVARGLRQPYLGYNSDADWVTASDQQGNWVPSTPLAIIKPGRFYGFRTKLDREMESAPVEEPKMWMPHQSVQSGAGQIYIPENSPTPYAGRMLYLDYYRGTVVLPYFNDPEFPTQGAATVLPVRMNTPVLKGVVSPSGKSVWLTGFKIWGSSAENWTGLTRLDLTQFPEEVPSFARSHSHGLLLTFNHPAGDIDPGSISIERWNYRRTEKYGSGYFNHSGEPGKDTIPHHKIKLSSDGRSLFLETGSFAPSHQVVLKYTFKSHDTLDKEMRSVFFTIHSPDYFPLDEYGFSDIWEAPSEEETIKSPGNKGNEVRLAGDEENGQKLFQRVGCIACHSTDGSTAGRSGPSLRNVWKARRSFADNSTTTADDNYLVESILDPSAKVLEAFSSTDIGMPSYHGILNDSQIHDLVAYIKSLSH